MWRSPGSHWSHDTRPVTRGTKENGMNTLVAIHVAGAVALAGANVAALATTVAARRATTPREVLRLLRVHNVFAEKTVVPSAIVVLATGAWLTATTGAPLAAPWM